MNVAMIGLGNMGSRIAQRLMRAGHSVAVWDRVPDRIAALVALSAVTADSSSAVAAQADLVLTSLMDDRSVLDALQEPQGLLAGMKPGAVHLCLTTISPACADELQRLHAAHGTRFVAGPVAGRPDAAAAGTLVTFLAGSPDAVATARPLCDAYARKAIVLGERPSVANAMKLCVNYTAVACIELMSEVYTFAVQSGIDPAHVRDFYVESFSHPALRTYANKLFDRDFGGEGGFALTGGIKDVTLMLAASADAGVAFEIGRIVDRKMRAALAAGKGSDDWSCFSEITRAESGL